MSYIGKKKVKKHEVKEDGEIPIIEVTYESGEVEMLSKLMFDEVLSDESCDDSTLRDKRVSPIVHEILKVLRNWGIKISELSYMSAILNTSLQENQKQALNMLWGKYMPKPQTPDEVDLITVDRVLKELEDEKKINFR